MILDTTCQLAFEFTDGYGNLCQRIVMPAGNFQLTVHCRAEVADQVDEDINAPLTPVQHLPTEVLQFLLPSRYCQSDELISLAASTSAADGSPSMPPTTGLAAIASWWPMAAMRRTSPWPRCLETSPCRVCR